MIIHVQTIDASDQHRYFSWGFTKLELACDILNEILSTGAKLISVELIEENRRVHLPINVSTEGELLFFTEIQELEREWQQLLSVPVGE